MVTTSVQRTGRVSNVSFELARAPWRLTSFLPYGPSEVNDSGGTGNLRGTIGRNDFIFVSVYQKRMYLPVTFFNFFEFKF